MTIDGIDGQTVQLKLINYEFPDNQDGDWDANWLNIFLKVDSKFGNWQALDPALTTWEVQEIIDWIGQLSNGIEPANRSLIFSEPSLSFQLLNEPTYEYKRIRIKFDWEFRPKNAIDDKENFVDISADKDALISLKDGLMDDLKKFPQRLPKS